MRFVVPSSAPSAATPCAAPQRALRPPRQRDCRLLGLCAPPLPPIWGPRLPGALEPTGLSSCGEEVPIHSRVITKTRAQISDASRLRDGRGALCCCPRARPATHPRAPMRLAAAVACAFVATLAALAPCAATAATPAAAAPRRSGGALVAVAPEAPAPSRARAADMAGGWKWLCAGEGRGVGVATCGAAWYVRARFPPHLSAEQSCRARPLLARGRRTPPCVRQPPPGRRPYVQTPGRQGRGAGGSRPAKRAFATLQPAPRKRAFHVARTYVLTHPAWRLRPSPPPLLAQGGRRPIAGAGTGDVRRHTPRAGAACVRPWCARGRPQGEAQGAAGSAYCTTWWWRTTHPPLAG